LLIFGDSIMKRFLLFLAVIALVLSVLSCGKKETNQKTVGVALLTRTHQFYQDLEEGLAKTSAKYGYKLVINSAEFDIGRQTSQVEDFITQKVDALIICPCDSKGITPSVKKANEAKIPVFTADIAASEADVVSHIASDNVAGGRKAGEYLAKLLNGKGDMALINHPTVTSVLDRVAGFKEVISNYPGIRIVADVDGGGERDRSLKATSDILQANPELAAIFGINDDSALGALGAVEQFNRKNIFIVGYDATPEAREAILRGTALKADVVQNPKDIGRMTIEAVHSYFSGGEVKKVIPVDIGIVDKGFLESEKTRVAETNR
jgi:ribose transport system substrate-binding protein